MQNWKDCRVRADLRRRYADLVPVLREAAGRCGYALAVHGSMERDLDLIAMPWVPKAMAPESLVMVIEEALIGLRHSREQWRKKVSVRPHGRLSYAIPFAWLADDFETYECRAAYVDLSVMPIVARRRSGRGLKTPGVGTDAA